jgi:hypothetical protein
MAVQRTTRPDWHATIQLLPPLRWHSNLDGGNQSGVLIEDSVIGPGFLQGVLLGEGPVGEDPWACQRRNHSPHAVLQVDECQYSSTIRNPRNWTIENVTSYREDGMKNHNIIFEGAGHTIRNSIFSGGRAITLPKDGVAVQAIANGKYRTVERSVKRLILALSTYAATIMPYGTARPAP